MGINDFDDVFPYIGGFGLFQYVIFFIICVNNILFCFLFFGQIFMVLTPPHWCATPPGFREELERVLSVNMSDEDWRRLTIPRTGEQEYSKCLRYDIDINSIDVKEIYNQSDFLHPNTSWSTLPCDNGWVYDFSLYYPTITSQLNWVCEEDWKPPLAQGCFFIGSMIGVPIFGWLADAYGRIPMIVASNLVGGVFGLASSFCSAFLPFCILRFIVGLAFDSNFLIIYILGLEYVSASHRSFVANVPILTFLTIALCATPWIAYALHDWTLFGIVIHAPFLLCLIIPWVTPESARWLINKGKVERATEIVKKAARVNNREIDEDFIREFENYASKASMKSTENVYFYDLLKTPNLRKRFIVLCIMWIAIFLVYDGHVRHTENIGSNVFVSFTLMGVVELPGDLLTIFSVEWLGRRHTTVLSLVFSGLAAMAITAIEKNETLLVLTFAIIGRFLITMAINVGQQYMIEILPTVGRAQGSAAIHTMGFGMAFVSPYIVYLSKYQHWLPYFIFGIISVTGGFICMLLPETLGEKLPDTLEDGEQFFNNQPFFYNPWNKENKLKAKPENRRLSIISRTSLGGTK